MFIFRFPFDIQTCNLNFTFHGYTSKEVVWEKLDQTLYKDPTVSQGWNHLQEDSIDIYDEELELKSENKTIEIRTTSVLVISVKLKRDSFAAWAFIIVPTLSITVFNIIAYILPPGEGMQIWLLI